MGKFSRDKGARIERLVRDEFRKAGFSCNRIPLSGAMEGFPGDLVANAPGLAKPFTVECKGRKCSFGSLYEALYASEPTAIIVGELEVPNSAIAVMSKNIDVVLNYMGSFNSPDTKAEKRAARKLRGLRKLVGTCDILVVKDDRKSPIYIRYL